jgi:hypothetical protein
MLIPEIGQCVSEKEAALRLGVSRATLLRARLRGEISCFRIGIRVVYSAAHLRDYLTAVERRRSANPATLPAAA